MKLQDQDFYREVCEEQENGSLLGIISLISMVVLVATVVMFT